MLTLSARGERKAPPGVLSPPGCSLCVYWGRVAWLRSLNRLASCKLSSFFSAFVKELRQVGEEIPGRQALEETPGTPPHGRLEKSDVT